MDYIWLQVIFLAFTVVTLPVYVLVLVTLIRFRTKFNTTYFTIFISTGIADIWLILHKYLLVHIPRLFSAEWLRPNVVVATWCKMGLWSIYFASVFGVCLMSANRLLVFCFPKSNTMNKKTNVRRFLLFQWLAPWGFAIPMLYPGMQSNYDKDFHPSFNNTGLSKAYYIVDIFLEVGIISPFLVLAYSAIYISTIIKANNESQASTNNRRQSEWKQRRKLQRRELRLASAGAVICGAYLLQCCTYILAFFGYRYDWIGLLFYCSSDIFTASNPWLLLGLSSLARRHFVAVLPGCGQRMHGVVPISTIRNVRVEPAVATSDKSNEK